MNGCLDVVTLLFCIRVFSNVAIVQRGL